VSIENGVNPDNIEISGFQVEGMNSQDFQKQAQAIKLSIHFYFQDGNRKF
jgi:hypothetical protein